MNIEQGVYIEQGAVIEEDVMIKANAVVLTKDYISGEILPTYIRSHAVIGASSIISPGVDVGVHALVKPGSVVKHTVPPLAIVEGNPAIIVGYRSTYAGTENEYVTSDKADSCGIFKSKIPGVTFHKFKFVSDLRGNLTVGDFEKEVPFQPKRYFIVLDVPTAETRGEHAHKECKQFLICVKGSCSVVADNGHLREEFLLDSADKGLYLPPMTWGIQYRYSHDAVLLVYASHHYDSADYIRDYNEFLSFSGVKNDSIS